MKRSPFHKLARSINKRFNRIFGRFVVVDRDIIGAQYLQGEGIEIGALHNPLKVRGSCKVRYVDNAPPTEAKKRFYDVFSKRLAQVDILDDGEHLGSIADRSQDFVIANHFIEHCQNPIGAIRNMLRVLKDGGILYLAIPDKRYTFDRVRPSTPFEHLVRDDVIGPEHSRREHLREWASLVEGVQGEAAVNSRISDLGLLAFTIHYHVWNQAELFNLMSSLREMFPFEVEMTFKRSNETIFVLRKGIPQFHAASQPTTTQVTGDSISPIQDENLGETQIT